MYFSMLHDVHRAHRAVYVLMIFQLEMRQNGPIMSKVAREVVYHLADKSSAVV